MFKKHIKETDAKDVNDALNHGWLCLKYFLIHKFWQTLILIFIVCGAVVYLIIDTNLLNLLKGFK